MSSVADVVDARSRYRTESARYRCENSRRDPTDRARARAAGAPAVRRHPDRGRPGRPARRRRAHGPPLRRPPARPGRAGRSVRGRYGGYRLAPGLPHAAADAHRRRGAGRAARAGRRPAGRVRPDDGRRPRPRERRRRSCAGCCPTPLGGRLDAAAGDRRLHRARRPAVAGRRHGCCCCSPRRPATAGRSRSRYTDRDGPHAATARCTRTASSPTPAAGTSPARTPRAARSGPSGSTGSRPPRALRARSSVARRRSTRPPTSSPGLAGRRGGTRWRCGSSGTAEQIRAPAARPASRRGRGSIRATAQPGPGRMRAERLDWVPALLAGLDLPFVIEATGRAARAVRALARRLDEAAGP